MHPAFGREKYISLPKAGGVRRSSMIYPLAFYYSRKGKTAKLLYEVRIPVNTDRYIAAAKKLLLENIKKDFLLEDCQLVRSKERDIIALKIVTEIENRRDFKYLVETVSESIAIFENYLLMKSIEEEG